MEHRESQGRVPECRESPKKEEEEMIDKEDDRWNEDQGG